MISENTLLWLIIALTIWDLIWKGFALWKACKNDHMPWFGVMLVLNTIGILPILYIFVFSKIQIEPKARTKSANKK